MSVLSAKIQANCQLSGVEILKNFSVTNLILGLLHQFVVKYSLCMNNIKKQLFKSRMERLVTFLGLQNYFIIFFSVATRRLPYIWSPHEKFGHERCHFQIDVSSLYDFSNYCSIVGQLSVNIFCKLSVENTDKCQLSVRFKPYKTYKCSNMTSFELREQ